MAHIHTAKIEDPDFAETYTACIQQNGDGWIGWIRDVPEVKCEERTREGLLEILAYELHKTLIAEWEAWSTQFEQDVRRQASSIRCAMKPLMIAGRQVQRFIKLATHFGPAIENFRETFNNSPTRNLNY